MTEPGRLRRALARGPVVLDAAIGTRLIAQGLDLRRDDPALWVLDHPDLVLDLHRRDVAAGSDALLTATFGASRGWLDRFGRGREALAIARRAVALAREAAGPDRPVLGSIGPAASASPRDLRELAEALASAGADALVLETHSPEQATAALPGVSLGLPILVSLFFPSEPGSAEDLSSRLAPILEARPAAIGVNCVAGTRRATAWAGAIARATDLPLLVKPSAGLPGTPLEPPSRFAAEVPRWLELGVRLLGGCCGTTDAHVASLRVAVDRAVRSLGRGV